MPMFSQALIYAPAKDWSDALITECEQFPYGKHSAAYSPSGDASVAGES